VTLIRAVLLDALGTLVELRPPWPALVAELAARGVSITEDQARAALLAEMAYYRAHHDEATGERELEALRDRCTEILRRALPPSAREVDDLRGALLASLRFEPYPEVPGVLDELGRMGLARVVVSNWDVSLHGVLAQTGLTPLIDGAVISAQERVAKPDPEIFRRALAVAGVGAEAAVHVGDTAELDVAGALAAGVRPVLVDRDGTAPTAAATGVQTMASLAALPGFVRSIVP
jgi:putative hydrolase of the HAD superfamily